MKLGTYIFFISHTKHSRVYYISTFSTFYLIGSTEDTICATVKKLKELYPDINIVGYRNGFIKETSEKEALLVDVKEKKPDFVFVAMGFPIQELLMYELYRIHTATYLNLGGSFDVFKE